MAMELAMELVTEKRHHISLAVFPPHSVLSNGAQYLVQSWVSPDI